MKKILLLFLLFGVASLLFLIFNDRGNEYLKPYLSTYLESQLKGKMEVEVEHLKIDYDYVEITAKINKLSRLHAYGDYNLLDKTLKLIYNLKSDGFKSKKLSFNNKIDINGTAIGLFNNLDIKGEGLAFDSKLNYKLKVEDELVKDIKIHLIRADIAQLLLLSAQPAYAKGKIDVDVDIPNLNNNQIEGKVHLVLHKTKLNEKVFNKEYKINLPKNTTVTAKADSTITLDSIEFNSTIKSNLSTIKLSNAHYNLKKKELFSNYNILIPELAKIDKFIGKKLRGEMTIDGEIKIDKTLYLKGKTTSLDGLIDFTLQDKQLNSTINDVSVQKLMYTLSYPQIFKASIVGKFDYNLATQQGILHSQLNKTQLLPNRLTDLVKRIRGIDLTKERYTKTDFNAKLNKALIDFDFNAKSKTVQLAIQNGQINKKANTINADYRLVIENKDIEGKIKGDISKPKVTIDGSQFIKKHIINRVKDEIGTERLKDLGIGKKETDAIKSILGNLFK